MTGKLDDTELTVLAEPTQRETRLLEGGMILGTDAIAAAEVFDRHVGPVERGGPRARDDVHALLRAGERAGQRRDDEPLGIGSNLGMIGVLEPEDIARELDDRVLKPASGADERHAPLPGETNGGKRAIHAAIRATG